MANTFRTPTWIGRSVLLVADNECRFVRNITKKEGEDYLVSGVKIGETVGVRLPQRFVTNKGQGFQGQNITDQVVFITITDQAQVGWLWSSFQGTFDVQDAMERYINPAGIQMANTWDKDGLNRLYADVYFSVGTPGVIPTANQVYYDAADQLTMISATPSDSRNLCLQVNAATAIANANVSLFGPRGKIDSAFEEGQFGGEALKWKKWLEDVNVYQHTYGTYGGTPLVNGANQTGSTLVTDGWSSGASTLNRGDTFTIGSASTGTYAVNAQSYQGVGLLQTFTVVQTISDTTGAMSIQISPPIVTSGPYQNVVASPSDNATINVTGTSGVRSMQNLGFHKQAFVMATAPPIAPNQGISRVVRKNGVSIRVWSASDIMTDQHPTRLDSFYGFKAQRPEFAVRVQG